MFQRDDGTGEINVGEAQLMDFRELLNNIPGIVFRCACDSDWTMQYISAGVELFTGYAPSELVGNTTRSFASLILCFSLCRKSS